MNKKIFVVTLPELGWDCVILAMVAQTKEDVIEYMKYQYFDSPEEWDEASREYVIHEETYINLCD